MKSERGLGRVRSTHVAAAVASALAALALVVPSDRRLSLRHAGLASPDQVREAIRSGPQVPPVRRRQPETPPWPQVLIDAGDIVPPVLAPDAAPLPGRKNAEMAAAHRAAKAQQATIVARSAGNAPAATPD